VDSLVLITGVDEGEGLCAPSDADSSLSLPGVADGAGDEVAAAGKDSFFSLAGVTGVCAVAI
jgi:hypothetical protein